MTKLLFSQIESITDKVRGVNGLADIDKSFLLENLSVLEESVAVVLAEKEKELEELRRTRESYRDHYEQRIEEQEKEISRKSERYIKLHKKCEELSDLIIKQARFMVGQDDNSTH